MEQTVPPNNRAGQYRSRRYEMTARADAVTLTRQRITVAAAARIRSAPGPLALLDVAADAGISRTTIYRHFAGLTELLDAVAADLLARARFDVLLAAAGKPDPVQALHGVIAAGLSIWAQDPELIRNLLALARAQDDAVPVVAQLEQGRAQVMTELAGRLRAAGRLRPGLTTARAADMLLVATAFEAWDQLVTARQRSQDQATAILTHLAIQAITAD